MKFFENFMDLFFGNFVVLETEVDCTFSNMCDCPLAGVITSHEAYRSWIIFKECKTEHGEYFGLLKIFRTSVLTVLFYILSFKN